MKLGELKGQRVHPLGRRKAGYRKEETGKVDVKEGAINCDKEKRQFRSQQ